jgi:hypothetical protein
MAHVAPPGQKLGEGRPECGVELRRLAEDMGQFRFSPPLSPERVSAPFWHSARAVGSAKKKFGFVPPKALRLL